MLVKCKSCQRKLDRATAYKVIVNDKNNYYCNELEYRDIKRKQEIKDNTYLKIYNIFGYKVTNTSLFKEINELVGVYGYEKIFSYLELNYDYLTDVMTKIFNSEYGQIRYFSTILRNNLCDFKIEVDMSDRQFTVDIPKDNYKPKQRKKSLTEYEMEM